MSYYQGNQLNKPTWPCAEEGRQQYFVPLYFIEGDKQKKKKVERIEKRKDKE